MTTALVLCADYAGLQAQALGLAERAGIATRVQTLAPTRWFARPPALAMPPEPLVIGCGGLAARVLARLAPGPRRVQVQHPRMDPGRFDLVVVNRHDRLTGPNVIVTRTALHRVTPARLADSRAVWTQHLAHLPRPLVAVLVGGSNGRFRLGAAEGAALAAQLAAMMDADRVGLAVTGSRRTDPAVMASLTAALAPRGAWVWDGQGDNPYFGLLACADAIVATIDSVSMVSEAVATAVPVLLATLPGRSRRQALFMHGLRADGRVRDFTGRLDVWQTTPIDDTQEAADTMRRRLGF